MITYVQSESALSASVDFLLPTIKLIAPAGLLATKTDQGIILNWDMPAVEALSGFNKKLK
jgi:hypothetical protein